MEGLELLELEEEGDWQAASNVQATIAVASGFITLALFLLRVIPSSWV
jgi:hypothetical protein